MLGTQSGADMSDYSQLGETIHARHKSAQQ